MWTETEQSLFDRLKAALVDTLVLAILDLTKNASFVIETDTSDAVVLDSVFHKTGVLDCSWWPTSQNSCPLHSVTTLFMSESC